MWDLQVDEMYRSGVKPWNSAKWRPSEKHIHEKVEAVEVRENKGKDDDSTNADSA